MTSTLHTITWTEMKALVSTGALLFYTAGSTNTNDFDIFATNYRDYFTCVVHGTSPGDSGKDFVDNYQGSATAVSSFGGFLAAATPPFNSLGGQLVEVTPRIHQRNSFIVVSHDYTEPCTWWQNSTQVTQEQLTFSVDHWNSAHTDWINIEHPKLYADETLDTAAWVAAGMPANLDPYYQSWRMPDASLRYRNYYYPIIQVQPGGTGSWVTADPADATTGIGNPNYGYTIDYVNGRVYFNSQLYWAVGTKVRATYFYAAETFTGSTFEVGPPVGKKWLLVRTEVQISSGTSWQDTVVFQGKQAGVVGTRGRYKTYGNMQSTSTSVGAVALNGGIAETPQSWAAGAENGWSHNSLTGLRNLTRNVEINPWDYQKPFVFSGNAQMSVAVSLASGKKFLTSDIVNVTFYIDEDDE
jgi:hypothetical protein